MFVCSLQNILNNLNAELDSLLVYLIVWHFFQIIFSVLLCLSPALPVLKQWQLNQTILYVY